MDWIRAFAPAVLAGCTAIVSLSASAQSDAAVGKRQKVDVRAMTPGPQASDAVADAPPPSGLTRDQRKEATLQARQDGSLRPTGEAADAGDAKSTPLASATTSATSPPSTSATTPTAAVAVAPPPTHVAAATPPPAKKSKGKKARPPAASAPA